MSKKAETSSSELMTAAAALDAELLRFEHLSRALDKDPLDSQKSIERATRSLEVIASAEEQLRAAVAALVAAVGAARDRQEAQALGVQRRAEHIQRRAHELKELVEAFAAIGAGTVELHQRLGAVAGVADGPGAVALELDAMLERIVEMTSTVEALGRRAHEAGFEDMERQAEQTRVQLVSTRGRFVQLQMKLVK